MESRQESQGFSPASFQARDIPLYDAFNRSVPNPNVSIIFDKYRRYALS